MIEINNLYKSLYTSERRYILLSGGRASLKSSTIHDFVSRLTFKENQGILYTRYTMSSAEKSIIPEFKIAIKRNNSEKNFHVTSNKITNKLTGSFILFSGIKTSSGDQTANLKSLSGITTWVIEEAEDFNDEESFDRIDDSIRTIDSQNRVIIIMNPTTQEHFIYKRFIRNHSKQIDCYGHKVMVSDHPDVEHIHTTYHIAKEYLSESFLKKISELKSSNPKKYYHTFIGGWLDKAEGAIFENWEIGEFDTSLPYVYGLDLGYFPDPTAMTMVAVNNKLKIIYVKELIYSTKLSYETVYLEVSRNLIKPNDLVISDTNEPRLINELRQKGLSVMPAEKYAGSVLDTIKVMQDYKIIVTPESQNFINELRNYAWHDKKNSVPIGEFDHGISSARYASMILIKKNNFTFV